MAKHEFGIMPNEPKPHTSYTKYEPQKYNCIALDDDTVVKIAPLWDRIDFYWHSPDLPAKGIAYTGITLIPPTSIQSCLAGIEATSEFRELKALLEKALSENKWVIHFGL